PSEPADSKRTQRRQAGPLRSQCCATSQGHRRQLAEDPAISHRKAPASVKTIRFGYLRDTGLSMICLSQGAIDQVQPVTVGISHWTHAQIRMAALPQG